MWWCFGSGCVPALAVIGGNESNKWFCPWGLSLDDAKGAQQFLNALQEEQRGFLPMGTTRIHPSCAIKPMEHLGYAWVTHLLGFDAMTQGHLLEMHWIHCCCGIQCVSKQCLLCLAFLLPCCSVRGAPARWGEPQLPLGEIVQLEQKVD